MVAQSVPIGAVKATVVAPSVPVGAITATVVAPSVPVGAILATVVAHNSIINFIIIIISIIISTSYYTTGADFLQNPSVWKKLKVRDKPGDSITGQPKRIPSIM